ncbi:MAG: hypothetical protein FWG79_09815 [Bacteroidales bacterium]|nr:hypothetical protein [Bacteroidales bacterium]
MRKTCVVHLSVLFILGIASSAFAQKAGEDFAKEIWRRVQKLESPKKNDVLTFLRDRRNLDTSSYWNDLWLLCQSEFFGTFEQVQEDQIENFAKTYAGFLGTKGPNEDIKWVFSCLPFASNSNLFNGNLDSVKQARYNKFSVAFNQAMIEKSLTSPEYYRSMYYVTMWARPRDLLQRNQGSFDSIGLALRGIGSDVFSFSTLPEKAKLSASDPEYWCKIRLFLVIAYMCNWDNNFKDFESPINHEYLQEAFTSFLQHYRIIANNPLFFNSLDFGNEVGMRYNLAETPKLPPFEFPNTPIPKLSIPFTKAGYELFIIGGVAQPVSSDLQPPDSNLVIEEKADDKH